MTPRRCEPNRDPAPRRRGRGRTSSIRSPRRSLRRLGERSASSRRSTHSGTSRVSVSSLRSKATRSRSVGATARSRCHGTVSPVRRSRFTTRSSRRARRRSRSSGGWGSPPSFSPATAARPPSASHVKWASSTCSQRCIPRTRSPRCGGCRRPERWLRWSVTESTTPGTCAGRSRARDRHGDRRCHRGVGHHARLGRPASGRRRHRALPAYARDHQGKPVLGLRLQRRGDPARRRRSPEPDRRCRRDGVLEPLRRDQLAPVTPLPLVARRSDVMTERLCGGQGRARPSAAPHRGPGPQDRADGRGPLLHRRAHADRRGEHGAQVLRSRSSTTTSTTAWRARSPRGIRQRRRRRAKAFSRPCIASRGFADSGYCFSVARRAPSATRTTPVTASSARRTLPLSSSCARDRDGVQREPGEGQPSRTESPVRAARRTMRSPPARTGGEGSRRTRPFSDCRGCRGDPGETRASRLSCRSAPGAWANARGL